jgi:hypothetical protein
MRLLGAAVATAALLLSVIPAADAAPPREGCRHQWADLAQLHGENGNPDGSGSTQQLQTRWDGYYKKASRLAKKATRSDCDGIGGFKASWGGLERLMYGMQPHDYLFQLRLANGDLHHFREVTGHDPGRQVMRAFRFLRKQAPKAAGDLAPVVDAAPAISTVQQAQVTGYLRDYRAAARASWHAMKAKNWLRIIRGAELGEE